MGWSFELLKRLSERGDIDTLIAAKRFAGREKDKAALRELEIIRRKLRERGS